jgi:hypothetical protein
MATTPNLTLPFIAPAQAQKHVTVNEGLSELDAVVQCAVLEMGRAAPPSAPAEGDRYLVAAAPDAAWSGQAGRLASWRNGGWAFSAPRPGWRVYDLATDTLFALGAAGAWTALSGPGAAGEIQNAARFGLGATADAAAPFAARLNTALWTARPVEDGGTGHLHVVCNKPAADRDAGHLFQSGFVTRALAGLFGSNRFRVAVSPDGATFRDALSVDDATGIVDQPRLPRFKAHTNFDNYAALDVWTRIAINVVESNDQGAFDPATNRFVAPAAGLYAFGGSLLHRANVSTTARMRGRLVRNGTVEIPGSLGEISGAHVSLGTALWLQTLTPLAKDDTVELQGLYRAADGYFAATHTTFWGFKIG